MFLKKLVTAIARLPMIITGVEAAASAGAGILKQQMTVETVSDLIGLTEAIAAKDIVDEKQFTQGLKIATSGIVQMFNASIWRKQAKAAAK